MVLYAALMQPPLQHHHLHLEFPPGQPSVQLGPYIFTQCDQVPVCRHTYSHRMATYLSAAIVLASDEEHMWMYLEGIGWSGVPPMTGPV